MSRVELEVPQENELTDIPEGRGYICICLPAERLAQLEIPMMVAQNQDPHRTAYAVTCDYKHGELPSPARARCVSLLSLSRITR